jgi:Flp pilus assembly protein TadG
MICHGLELAVNFAILAALNHFAVGEKAKIEAEGSR